MAEDFAVTPLLFCVGFLAFGGGIGSSDDSSLVETIIVLVTLFLFALGGFSLGGALDSALGATLAATGEVGLTTGAFAISSRGEL